MEAVVFELLITLKHITDEKLTVIFTAKGKGIEKVKKEKLSWICVLMKTYNSCGVWSASLQSRVTKCVSAF